VRQERWAVIPRHRVSRIDDVVAAQRRDGDKLDVGDVELAGESGVLVADPLERALIVINQVHLVDRNDDMLDPQQRDDERVSLRLRQQAAAGIDQNDRQVARAGTRRHVAGVLLVSGGVGDDELALVGREVAVSDIDRNTLLTLGLEAVGQQRQIDFAIAPRRAKPPRVTLHGLELVLVNHLRVVQQTADERGLAVVHGAAGEEAQQLLALVTGKIAVDVFLDQFDLCHGGAQKYPSRFFCSIDAVSS
jgi:hypothetical protein